MLLADALRWVVLRSGRAIVQERARRGLHRNEPLWDTLTSYRAHSRSAGCEWADYQALYREIRRHRPREVLECGTGVSTVVMAHALLENAAEDGAAGRITSMEESPTWLDMAAKLLPAELAPFVDLRHSPTVEACYMLFRGMRYRDVPDRSYDLVFVDGPSTRTHDGQRSFDFDLIHVLQRARKPVRAVIDGRLVTCFVLQAVLGEKLRFDPWRNLGFVAPCTGSDLRLLTRSRTRSLRKSVGPLRDTHLRLALDPAPSDRGALEPDAPERGDTGPGER